MDCQALERWGLFQPAGPASHPAGLDQCKHSKLFEKMQTAGSDPCNHIEAPNPRPDSIYRSTFNELQLQNADAPPVWRGFFCERMP
jgi:hypothetical protein